VGVGPAHGHADGTGWDGAHHVDLLVGGFPCQDLSIAGKRAGLGGSRSSLFYEYVRIAQALRPPWGIVENVPGLVSSHRGRDMETVLAGLRECWPAVGYRILDSQYFGVPQRRRRVFLVGGPTETGVASVLALGESGGGDSPAGDEAGTDVAHCLARGATGAHGRYDPNGEDYVIGQCHGTNVGPMGALRSGDGGLTSGVPFVMNLRGREEGARAEFDRQASLRASSGGSSRSYLVHALTAEGHDASEDGTGRGVPLVTFDNGQGDPNAQEGDTGYALNGQGHQGIAIGTLVRRLTPVECERLQGFPDGWTCLCQPLTAYADDPDEAALACRCPDGPRYRALGNAVTVSVLTWIGQRLPMTRAR
jgi:DNA (cytosine-5)-methyltransferase 1